MQRMFDWTDERIEKVKRLWADGFSAARIAGLIGTTRNSVIGKVNRLNLLRRDNRPTRKPRPPRRKTTVTIHRPKVATIDPPAAPPPVEIWEPAPDPAGNLTVLDLTAYTCKWPIGDVGQPGFTFCGARPIVGLPYCAYHARKKPHENRTDFAYVTPRDWRRDNAQR